MDLKERIKKKRQLAKQSKEDAFRQRNVHNYAVCSTLVVAYNDVLALLDEFFSENVCIPKQSEKTIREMERIYEENNDVVLVDRKQLQALWNKLPLDYQKVKAGFWEFYVLGSRTAWIDWIEAMEKVLGIHLEECEVSK